MDDEDRKAAIEQETGNGADSDSEEGLDLTTDPHLLYATFVREQDKENADGGFTRNVQQVSIFNAAAHGEAFAKRTKEDAKLRRRKIGQI